MDLLLIEFGVDAWRRKVGYVWNMMEKLLYWELATSCGGCMLLFHALDFEKKEKIESGLSASLEILSLTHCCGPDKSTPRVLTRGQRLSELPMESTNQRGGVDGIVGLDRGTSGQGPSIPICGMTSWSPAQLLGFS